MRLRARMLAMVALLALAGGCSPGPDAPKDGGPRIGDVAAAPTSRVVTHRTARISVPEGMYPQTVEFADAAHGYVQYVSREPVSGAGSADPKDLRYGAALYATADGGRTWRTLAHPRPVSANPQLYVVDARTIVLNLEPYGWYVSSNGGRSYRQDPPDPTGQFLPPEYDRIWQDTSSAFRLDCEPCIVSQVDAAGTKTRLAQQPTMSATVRALAETAGGTLWVAGMDGTGRPQVQLSKDRGASWRPVALPAQGSYGGDGAGGFDWLELATSRDHADVWLVGYSAQSGGGGAAAPGAAALKVSGVPVIWRANGDALVAKGLAARPSQGPEPPLYTAVPIGGQLLAVSGPGCLCLVDDGWISVPTPRPIEFIRTLPDGTVFGSAITNRAVYLGTRAGRELAWVEVELP